MVDEDLQDLLFEFRKISGDIESHYQEREKLLQTLKDTEENLTQEKNRNTKLENELKRKEEIIDLINKQLAHIPELMGELEKKKAELRRSKNENARLSKDIDHLKFMEKLNDNSKTSLERKWENAKLTKQLEDQNEELVQLKEEMRKLKEDSFKKTKEADQKQQVLQKKLERQQLLESSKLLGVILGKKDDLLPQLQSGLNKSSAPQLQSGLNKSSAPQLQSGLNKSSAPQLQSGLNKSSEPQLQSGLKKPSEPQSQAIPSKPSEPQPLAIPTKPSESQSQAIPTKPSESQPQAILKKSSEPQLQSVLNKPSEKAQGRAPTPVPIPAPSRRRPEVVSAPPLAQPPTSAPVPSKKEEERSFDSAQTRFGHQIQSAEYEQSAKRAKLDKNISVNKGHVRSTQRSMKPQALIKEDLNEDFWKKLAVEEAKRKMLYPHQLVDSPWSTGPKPAPMYKFARLPDQVKQEPNTNPDTGTVRTKKRKLYNKSSKGPEQF